jgi:nucleoside-diphosphate-sugar epimerase
MIFVTGGTGLIGSHLLYDLAKKGERVRALKRSKSETNEVKKIFSYYTEDAESLFSKIEWVEGDLLDVNSLFDALDGTTHVYHCAAMVSMNPEDRKKMIENNLKGTSNMVNAALEKKVQKFCHVSSVAALGIEPEKEITEETGWNNKTNFSGYAVSKYLSENEVWRASQEGLNVTIVNPTVVIGPGNWRRSSGDIFLGANKGLRWFTEGGIGYVDVRDVSKAMVQLMESEIKNEKFILTSENLSYRKFFDLVYSSIRKPLPNKKAGKIILQFVWRLDKLRSVLTGTRHILTKEIARYSSMKLYYSNSKIKKAIAFEFIPVSESIKHTASHFLSDISAEKK